MIRPMLAIWFLVCLPFLNLVWIWKFLVHILLKPSLKDFDHYLASMWNEHSSLTVWIHSILCPVFQLGLADRTMYLRLGVVTITRLGLLMDLDTGSLRSRCWQRWFLLRPLSLTVFFPSVHLALLCLCPDLLFLKVHKSDCIRPHCNDLIFSLVTSLKICNQL